MARSSLSRVLIQTAAAVFVLLTAYAALPMRGRSWVFGLLGALAVMLGVIPVLVRRVRSVLQSDHPVAEAICAVVIAVTLMVVGPAAGYYVIVVTEPSSFSGLTTRIDAIYFSVTVMSSVGFGDVVPVSQAARMVTTLHIVLALALLGASLRLVTWAARRRLDDQTP